MTKSRGVKGRLDPAIRIAWCCGEGSMFRLLVLFSVILVPSCCVCLLHSHVYAQRSCCCIQPYHSKEFAFHKSSSQRSKPQFLTAAQSLKVFSLDAGLRMDGLPALRFWERVLVTSSSKAAKENLERHTSERVIPSHSHSDNYVFFLSQLTMSRPTFPTDLTQSNF